MKYISLYFQDVMQSFGSKSKFKHRGTEDFPTRSAITGMICNGAGLFGEQEEFLSLMIKECKISVYSFCIPTIFEDFQTIGSSIGHEKFGLKKAITKKIKNNELFFKTYSENNDIVYKNYLANAKFGIIIETENEDLFNIIFEAFNNPKNVLFLGRKCCILTGKAILGAFDSKEEAINVIKNFSKQEKIYYEILEEDNNSDEVFSINDVPTKFGKHIEYSSRIIFKKWY